MLCALIILASLLRIEAKRYTVVCKVKDYSFDLERNGCKSKTINVKACLGSCLSEATPTGRWPFFRKECACCKAVAVKHQPVILSCNSRMKIVHVPSATRCECQDCRRH